MMSDVSLLTLKRLKYYEINFNFNAKLTLKQHPKARKVDIKVKLSIKQTNEQFSLFHCEHLW
jgi:hypothetical protein